jgi:hypothetical protein
MDDRLTLDTLDVKLRTLLPEEYQDAYEDVQPMSMGSAGLKFAPDGRVAWNDMWATFCDLAMAGGPPHKGTLLEPAMRSEIAAQPHRYHEVVDEICRGIGMVTDFIAERSPVPGWIRVPCLSPAMAGWLLRAIVMENVAAHAVSASIDVPAGPAYRLEKEIKNVITVMAKTCHYWMEHMSRTQQRAIAELLAAMNEESPLVEPAASSDDTWPEVAETRTRLSDAIRQQTGLRPSNDKHTFWLGVECPDVRSAVWMMRAMVVTNVLSRREGTALFLPVNPAQDPGGDRVAGAVGAIHRLAKEKGVI